MTDATSSIDTTLPAHGRPDFAIIGAMKSATSTLQAQLAAQPGIFMTDPKEPNFFSDPENWSKGLDWYAGLYSGAQPGDLLGEASTHYTKLPTYPETIDRFATHVPHPKLVYLIRNPVRRAISHYVHEWSLRVMGPDPVEEFNRHDVLVDYGCYAMQIAPWIERFGADSILLTSLEAIKARPDAVLEEVARFIGYDGPVQWVDEKAQENSAEIRYRHLPFSGLLIDNPVARTLRRTLVPKSLREKVRQSRTMDAPPQLPDDLIARLEARFLEDRAELAKLFPGHVALDECYPFAKVA